MDQAKSENQIVSGYVEECGAVANMGGYDLFSPHVLHQIPDKIQRITIGIDTNDSGSSHDA